MLSVAPTPTIFLHTDATDMRKSFTGLCGLIRSVFGDDPADGSLFLFVKCAACHGASTQALQSRELSEVASCLAHDFFSRDVFCS